MALADVAEVLGGEQVLRQPLHHRLDLITLSRRGIPKVALVHLAHFLSCPLHDLVALLPVTERTLQRYTPQQPLNRMVSEHILQLAEVAARGVEVFGDKATFLAWLHHPNTALGHHIPMSLLNSRFGAEMVLDELGRLEHGIVA
jgi:putative toxin-antitoxin system antitoxin component (TIGR02293 family)